MGFSYLLADTTYATPVPGQVTIIVVPDPEKCITARDDYYTTPFNTQLTVAAGQAIIANDSSTCAQAPALRVVSNGQPVAGTGSVGAVAPGGTFTYTPASGFTGAPHARSCGSGGGRMRRTASACSSPPTRPTLSPTHPPTRPPSRPPAARRHHAVPLHCD